MELLIGLIAGISWTSCYFWNDTQIEKLNAGQKFVVAIAITTAFAIPASLTYTYFISM